MSSSSPSLPLAYLHRAMRLAGILALSLSLGACDYVTSFTKPKRTPEEIKAEGIAVGAGCRQVGQSLEECYQHNPDSLKAGIFAGWKDMHEYMAAKNIQTVEPPAAVPPPPPELTDAEKEAAAKAEAAKDAPVDERAARREKRERERAEREKDQAKSKSDDSDKSQRSKSGDSDMKSKSSDSGRKKRDDSLSKN